jgi:hypothetical protein
MMRSHKKMVDALHAAKNSTQESAAAVLENIVVPNCGELVPFTGYYSMDVAPGAFLSIDTNWHYSSSPLFPLNYDSVEISVSLDGKTSQIHPFDFNTSFDGKTLSIPGVLSLVFTRGYQDGVLTTFSGTIGNVPVTGSTRFNPVPLSAFAGTYIEVDPLNLKTVLSVTPESQIKFDFGTGLQEVGCFTYNPAMYVLMFTGTDQNNHVLMLGTAGHSGLACSIQVGSTASFAVTIP